MDTRSRWLAWTGPLYTVAFIAALVLEGNTPGEKASPEKVMDFYNSHQGRTLTEGLLSPLLAALVVLFASHLRTLARERDLAPGAGPSVMLAGSVLWASGILIGATVSLGLMSASDHGFGEAAQTLNVLSNCAWLPYIGGVAVMLIGAGMTVLRTGILPRWLGWVAAVVGVVSLAGPGGFAGFLLSPLWLLVAGVLVARTPAAVGTPAPAQTVSA